MRKILMILACCVMLCGCAKEEGLPGINKFDYEISGDAVKLKTYKGNGKVLEITSSYDISGTEYQTDLSEFQIGNNKVETFIIPEGITEVETSIFNSSNVKKIFFPSSMEYVYDYTLSYLHPDDGEKVEIYYAGSQTDWWRISRKYEESSDGAGLKERWNNADSSYEKGEAVGGFLADKLNDMIGSGYDSSDFDYHYNSSPSDLIEK